jgi:DNA-binding NarL/FixJ family response regulator
MTNTITIAIAEDHDLYRQGLRNMLTQWGYSGTINAVNGQDLAKQLTETETLPHICIIDIEMPVMNGPATTALIKENWPQIKVIGHSMLDAANEMLGSGAEKFVLKGDIEGLRASLHKMSSELASTYCH